MGTAADSQHRQAQLELTPGKWALTREAPHLATGRGGGPRATDDTSPCPGGPPDDILDGSLPPGSEMPVSPAQVTSSFLAGSGENTAHGAGSPAWELHVGSPQEGPRPDGPPAPRATLPVGGGSAVTARRAASMAEP